MNKKSIIKNIFIILITILMLSTIIIPNYCYADSLGLGDLDKYEGTGGSSTKLEKKAGVILTYIRTIGVILTVVILIVIGIKYMMGSVEEKANYKETLLPYIIGAFLLFTGSLLPQLIYDIINKF